MPSHTHIAALLLGFTPFLTGFDAKELAQVKEANIQRPSWSSNGAKISFEANFHKEKIIQLHIGTTDPDSFRQITPSVRASNALTSGFQTAAPSGLVSHELSWGPSPSNHFVYASANADGDYDLHLSSGGKIAASIFPDGGPAWSPNGRHIAFTSSRTGEGDVYLIDTSAVDRDPVRLSTHEGASEVYIGWSPDSQQLVYVSHTQQGDNLWWLPHRKSAPVRLTSGPGSQTRPQFSPDGAFVAFYQRDAGSNRLDLYVLELGGSNTSRPVAQDIVANTAGPVWSPDGKYLLFVCNDDAKYDPLCAVKLDQPETPILLESNTVGHGDIAVNPTGDGNWYLAYVAQGLVTDTDRSFKRLFLATISLP
jgi:Tol biopolymer transport system component